MNRSPGCFHAVLGALVLLLIATPVHAQSGTPTANPAYTTAFADARAQATSDFERDVLADDVITQAEYDEATHRFVMSMRAEPSGYTVDAAPDPLIPGATIYQVEGGPNVPPEVRKRILESHMDGTTELIEPLFIATIVNPANTDLDALTLDCLLDRELVDASFSAADLPALREDASSATSRFNPYRTSTTPDDAIVSCLANPAQTGLTPLATPSS